MTINKKHPLIGLLLLGLSWCVQAQSDKQQTSYTTITKTITSQVMAEQRQVVVQLPKSYHTNPTKKYPIIYRLDGASTITMINAVMESLQSQRAAPEVIIVAIENTDRLRDLYPTENRNPAGPIGVGGGAAKFLKFITTELMPDIENTYRVHDFRIVAGGSAAGVFSLYALQQHPELFDAALTYSAAVWWADGATGQSTVDFLKRNKSLNHYIYTAIGNEAAPMRPYYDQMITGLQEHSPRGLRWVNDVYPDVPHNLVSTAARFRAYHNLFYSELMQPKDYTGDIASVENYYAKVSAQRGETITAPEWVIRQLGYHFVTQQNYAQAIKLFEYGIATYPNIADAHNGLAYGHEQAGNYEQALTHVNKALALANKDNPGYPVYQSRQTRLKKQLGR